MASIIYMHGLMTTIVVVETPDVVEQKVQEAKDDADDTGFVTLNSLGSYMDVHEAGRDPQQGLIFMEGERKDSFTPVKVRHEAILAVRGDHPGEVPE